MKQTTRWSNSGRKLGVLVVLGAVLVTAAGVAPSARGRVAYQAAADPGTDPDKEAARYQKLLDTSIKMSAGVSGVTVEVFAAGGGKFGIVLTGQVDSDAALANALAEAYKLGADKFVVYSSKLTAKAKDPNPEKPTAERVRLFWQRTASSLVTLLKAIDSLKTVSISAVGEDQLVLVGTQDARNAAKRIIASLDLPQPGVDLEVWGVQISSERPNQMAGVLRDSRKDIDQAKATLAGCLTEMEHLAARLPLDQKFASAFTSPSRGLGYVDALNPTRVDSLSAILLRLIAADHPSDAAVKYANNLAEWTRLHAPDYLRELNGTSGSGEMSVDEFKTLPTPPFERFFEARGLEYKKSAWQAEVGPNQDKVEEHVRASREAILRFAKEYREYVHSPATFSPYYLQLTADVLNTRLQRVTRALNLDLNTLFTAPTLERIRKRVEHTRGVEYAQVGRTSVATLSGVPTTVSGSAVSQFDVTPPLRLSELLDKASDLSSKVDKFIPGVPGPNGTTVPATLASGIPYSQLIGLIGAMGEERSVWREMNSGVSLSITPNVLHNASSAELGMTLALGDPLDTTKEKDPAVKPLSRITKHEVTTRFYINSLDLLDISTFSSEATLGGNREYFPIVGTIWKGVFGEVPVIGNLFSWKRNPRSVYHQSLLLANALITPTAMSVALLLPNTSVRLERGTLARELQAIPQNEPNGYGTLYPRLQALKSEEYDELVELLFAGTRNLRELAELLRLRESKDAEYGRRLALKQKDPVEYQKESQERDAAYFADLVKSYSQE